jgi:ribonuclease P protein component
MVSQSVPSRLRKAEAVLRNLETDRIWDYSQTMTGDGEGRFPSTMRLKRRKDFQRVYRGGVVWKGSCFCLRALKREDGVRLGIVVPRQFGTAVERNRTKRRLREAFRRIASSLPSADVIVWPEANCDRHEIAEMGRMLATGIEKALTKEVQR